MKNGQPRDKGNNIHKTKRLQRDHTKNHYTIDKLYSTFQSRRILFLLSMEVIALPLFTLSGCFHTILIYQ